MQRHRSHVASIAMVAQAFSKFLTDVAFLDSIGMHLLPDEGSQARGKLIIDRIKAIAKLSSNPQDTDI